MNGALSNRYVDTPFVKDRNTYNFTWTCRCPSAVRRIHDRGPVMYPVIRWITVIFPYLFEELNVTPGPGRFECVHDSVTCSEENQGFSIHHSRNWGRPVAVKKSPANFLIILRHQSAGFLVENDQGWSIRLWNLIMPVIYSIGSARKNEII